MLAYRINQHARNIPESPKTTNLTELRARVGNDRLKGLLDQADTLKPEVSRWKKQGELAAKRLPEWEKLQRFLVVGAGVGALAEVDTAAHGILEGRLLLDISDHVPPLLKQAAQSLRTAVTSAHQAYAKRYANLFEELEASDIWQEISDDQRNAIMKDEGIVSVPDLEVGSDDQIMQLLQKTPVSSWKDKSAALTERFQAAAHAAAKLLEPKTQYIKLKSGTLRTEAEVKVWLAEQEGAIVAKLKEGPVVIG
jgi:hypothetical protein